MKNSLLSQIIRALFRVTWLLITKLNNFRARYLYLLKAVRINNVNITEVENIVGGIIVNIAE